MNLGFIILFSSLLIGCATEAGEWHHLADKKTDGVSGIAIVANNAFLVVHDNKKPNEPRLGLVHWDNKTKPSLTNIDWCDKSNLPIDLEAIAAIPGSKNEYLTLESKGHVSHIRLTDESCSIKTWFQLPNTTDKTNLEALALHCNDQMCVLAWAERGSDTQPAKVFWSNFQLEKNSIQLPSISTFEFTAPFPKENRRSISDMAIDTKGVLWISAVSDPGDQGPFQSALYKLGAFSTADDKIIWSVFDSKEPIFKYESDNAKIEAIAFTENGLFIATDDEEQGSQIVFVEP